MVAFIFGCGTTHLFNAYTVFHPIYIAEAWFKLVNGLISVGGAVAIAYALVRTFAVVVARRKKLEELEKLHERAQ